MLIREPVKISLPKGLWSESDQGTPQWRWSFVLIVIWLFPSWITIPMTVGGWEKSCWEWPFGTGHPGMGRQNICIMDTSVSVSIITMIDRKYKNNVAVHFLNFCFLVFVIFIFVFFTHFFFHLQFFPNFSFSLFLFGFVSYFISWVPSYSLLDLLQSSFSFSIFISFSRPNCLFSFPSGPTN